MFSVKKLWGAVGLLSVVALQGCFPPTGAAPARLSPEGLRAAQAAAPDATEEELESGRQVFIANCNTCHGYPDIREFEPAELREIVPRMADKAELDPSEGARLLRFVLGLRASQ